MKSFFGWLSENYRPTEHDEASLQRLIDEVRSKVRNLTPLQQTVFQPLISGIWTGEIKPAKKGLTKQQLDSGETWDYSDLPDAYDVVPQYRELSEREKLGLGLLIPIMLRIQSLSQQLVADKKWNDQINVGRAAGSANVKEGDKVKVTSGQFQDFEGTIKDIKNNVATIEVIVFGKPARINVELWAVSPLPVH